jgi:hypothetical protein
VACGGVGNEMAQRLDLMIHWEIDAIERILDEVPKFLTRRAEKARRLGHSGFPDGKLSDEEAYLAACSLTRASIVYHLNAVIDWFLITLATRILPPEWGLTPQSQSRSRGQLIRAIEGYYKLTAKNLPGWSEVDELREEANALKHRGGDHLPEPSVLGVPLFRGVDTSPETLRARMLATRTWLIAVWECTEGKKVQAV